MWHAPKPQRKSQTTRRKERFRREIYAKACEALAENKAPLTPGREPDATPDDYR